MDLLESARAPPHRRTALRRYFVCIALGNLLWEVAQLPLYTIWITGTRGQLAFAVVHCTAGDLLIATLALLAALVTVGNARWPAKRFTRVAFVTVGAGVAYTIFSEWLNLVVRQSWAYSEAMPVVPLIGVGLSPLLQWLVIPGVAMLVVRRSRSQSSPGKGAA